MISPRVVIGIPLFNNGKKAAESVESLLTQEMGDFHLVLVDDCSTDNTCDIVEGYARRDSRVTLVRNAVRMGYLGNARKAFQVSRRLYPEAEYFAWASDHDVCHPRWLKMLASALDKRPEAVLAYPRNMRIGETGDALERKPRVFDTRGMADARSRLRAACQHMAAGDMVYGLARASAIEQCGSMRDVLMPDRLLMGELALLGEFVQVPEILWYRRYDGLTSMSRQRRNLFPYGAPLHAWLPISLVHSLVLYRELTARGRSASESLVLAADYAWTYMVRDLGTVMRRVERWRKRTFKGRWKWVAKRARRVYAITRRLLKLGA